MISFSQSGQLSEIVAALLMPLRANARIEITEKVLVPTPTFPFPWSLDEFLDVFPESFQEHVCQLEMTHIDQAEHFDLVIVAYQVWFLSPSIPVSSFLQSAEAKRILRNTPVVTIVGARNMWYRAHERIKHHLRSADSHLVGHIALTDRAFNLVSVVTIVHWMVSGRKERMLGLLPKPGVSDQDIAECEALGSLIENAVLQSSVPDLQPTVERAGACRVVPHLLFLEQAATRAFAVWSKMILRNGPRGNPRRRFLIRMFGFYLACGIAILSPLSFLLFYLTLPLRWTTVQRQIEQVHRY